MMYSDDGINDRGINYNGKMNAKYGSWLHRVEERFGHFF